MVRDEAQRDKDEQEVEPRAKQEKFVGLDPSGLIIRYNEELRESLPVGEPTFMAISAIAVL